MSYMTISSQEKHNFSLCSCFHAHPTTLLLKILGGPMHGRSPTSNFGGTVPPVPLGPRPWFTPILIPSNTPPPFCPLVTQIFQSLHSRSCPASLEQTPASITTNI